MNKSIKISTKQAKPILQKTFPQYKGRKIRVELANKVYIHDTNWSGGTRNKYMALQSNGDFNAYNAPAPWVNKEEGKAIDMVPGMMIVMHTIFCGKDIGITIYIHPSNAPKWITEGE